MDRKTTICFVLALVLLGALVISLGSGGFPRSIIRQVEAETASLSEGRRQHDGHRKTIEGHLGAEPELFARRDLATTWRGQLEEGVGWIDRAGKELDSARALVEAGDPEKAEAVQRHVETSRSLRARAIEQASAIRQQADRWVSYKRDHGQKLEEAGETHRAIDTASLEDLRSTVGKAAVDWPGKKAALEGRLQAVQEAVARGRKTWAESEALRQRPVGELEAADFEKLIAIGTSLETDLDTITAARRNLPALVEQLYWAWDRTLVDLEIREGRDVTFHVTKRTSRTRVEGPPPAGADAEQPAAAPVKPVVETSTAKVSEREYKSVEKHLGMTIEHKPAGRFDHESEKVVQPPGYAYMCSPEQKRNRYGEWRTNSSGGSFWVFYGQYALMRNLFWGPSRSGWVNDSSWRDYSSSRSRGQTYYGRDASNKPRFGKGGSFTSTRYGSSKYVKTGGYKSSRYVTSGGKFRGTRYQSSSSSRSSFGSSRSSRSSSFGSSRSRSSSFGGSRFGGGK